MFENYLENLKEEFSSKLIEIQEEISNAEKQRKIFLSIFPKSKLPELTIEEYVIGKENSFCYWLEQKLDKLGRIKGGSIADKKFGLYYGKTNNDSERKYRTIPKWGNSIEGSFKNIKYAIIKLLNDAEKLDFMEISKSKLSNNFRGKILATYYPERFLNIFSIEHIEHFLDLLQVKYDRSQFKTVELKKELLLKFKSKDDFFKNLSNNEFVTFLYNKLTPPKTTLQNPKSIMNVKFVEISKIKVREIDLKVNDIDHTEKSTTSSVTNNSFDEDHIKRVGFRGELIVLNYEKEFLRKNNQNKLANRVDDVSKKNLGFDILSYNLDGSERKIEVKSTTQSPPLRRFYVTKNEKDLAENNGNYIFYFLFNVNSKTPSLFKFNPFFNDNKYLLEPLTFKVKINSELNDA